MASIKHSICYQAPGYGLVAFEYTYYVAGAGLNKMRLRYLETGDDLYDHGVRAYSTDNGRTWEHHSNFEMSTKTTAGTVRRVEMSGFVDPVNGWLLHIGMEATMPNDLPIDGMTQWYMNYRTSKDGGITTLVNEQIIQRGAYTPEHPLESVWVGKNAVMYGAEGSVLRTQEGHLLVATMLTPLGPDGRYANLGGQYTWTEILLLVGEWKENGKIEWTEGARVAIDPSRSTRGLAEPTLAQMADGRILMVMRGSNSGKETLPAHKWYSVSSDGGKTWSDPQPWHYSNGRSFYSPSSFSQLVRHSNGRLYWFGNISKTNPAGNAPRYPLVFGEIDPRPLMLIEDSVQVVDTLRPDDHPSTQFSNFNVHEDRQTGELLVHMPRLRVEDDGAICGDGQLYRITLPQ